MLDIMFEITCNFNFCMVKKVNCFVFNAIFCVENYDVYLECII